MALANQVWMGNTPFRIMHSEKNQGERGNVNNAIVNLPAEIDWILLLHSDDIAKPNWLPMMFERMQSCGDNVASICSSWDNFHPDGRIDYGEDNPWREIEIIKGTEDSVKDTIERGCWWHISGCAIRRRAFEAIGGFKANMPQMGDWEWLLRCLSSGWDIEYIPRTLILYRQSDNNVSSNSFRTNRDIKESLEVVRDYALSLSLEAIARFHLKRIWYITKRAGSSVLKLDGRRLASCIQATFLIRGNLLQCLLRGRRTRGVE